MHDGHRYDAHPISAVLAAIDGTLVTRDQVLTEKAIQAVNRLRDRGIAFTICSGRSPRGMFQLVEALRLSMPMAAFNGGVIVLPDLSVLDERVLPEYIVPAIVDAMDSHGLDVWIYSATDWYIRNRQGPHVDDEVSATRSEPTVVPNFDAVLNGVVKIVGVSNDQRSVATCEGELQQTFGSQLSALWSPPYYLDVTHPTANTGTVVERLARYLKIRPHAIASIGDQPADVLMFKQSGLSIAMANSPDQVKKQATHVTTSYDDEGFANAVEQFILPRALPGVADVVKATGQLHHLGQSLWLDNITRDLLSSGTLKRYIDRLSVTGLTSNPTIFENAIKNSQAYDTAIAEKSMQGKSGEALFFDLALEDLRRAADLFRPIYDRTNGVDGWVSLEVSPLLAHDTAGTISAAKTLFSLRAGRPNLMIKIPGTPEGLPAIEEAVFAGISVNVTLLFSREHYFAAAEAFLRGLERRLASGLRPDVVSVASVFVSRWDSAVAGTVPEALRNQLGIAMARRIYKAYRSLLTSPRWQRVYNAGGRPQRLLWASTGTKDPHASDVMYIKALAAPFTVNTIPEPTLNAFADHGEISGILRADGGDCEAVLRQFVHAGIDLRALAVRLQQEGATAFVKSWHSLMSVVAAKSARLTSAT